MAYRLPKARKGNRVKEMIGAGQRLAMVLERLGSSEKGLEIRLWQNWPMVMGPDITPLACPLGSRKDSLLIGGEDNLALQDLSFMTPEILERANAFLSVIGAPLFNRVELHLIMGQRPLDQPPTMQPATRPRPFPPRPSQLGEHLAEMRPDSPVARCYAAYLKMHGVL